MQLYNTLSRQLESFAPAGAALTMYVCGVTPYDTTHLGHARCYLVYDLLQRYVRYQGHDVRYVQNVTDIDDDVLRKARELGLPFEEVTRVNLEIFCHDMEALNVLPPAVWPRATQEVPTMLEIAGALIARGQAYEREGNVYFRAATAADFGALSRRTPAEMIARLREERFDPDDPRKEHPLDILMWQAAAPDEPTWESPWGPGRPGWHIECTAMALRHLGTTIDVHGGGEDLIFSHHESERAQAETYTGVRPFVRFWIYAGTVYAGAEKMSKSLRNLVLVRDLLPRFSGDAIRLYLARAHYRAHLTYDEAALVDAADLVARLRAAAALVAPGEGPSPEATAAAPDEATAAVPEEDTAAAPDADDFRARFEAAMDSDLDTPGAVEVLRALATTIEEDRTGPAAVGRAALLNELASVLGLRLAGQPTTAWPR